MNMNVEQITGKHMNGINTPSLIEIWRLHKFTLCNLQSVSFGGKTNITTRSRR